LKQSKSVKNKSRKDLPRTGQSIAVVKCEIIVNEKSQEDRLLIEEIVSPEPEKKKDRQFKNPSKNVKKAENRWGMEVDDVSNSAKKRIKNQKQSKLDGFFKDPPQRSLSESEKNFKRVNHIDTDLERALQLSKEASSVKSEGKEQESLSATSSSEAMESPMSSGTRQTHEDKQSYAYVNDPVRGKEARKKLYGFDCRECQEYYHMKLEEGYCQEQILKMLNDCSRHRGLFKPPITPEKYWDPEIVVEANDPREQTQYGQPLRSRAKRRAEERAKKAAKKLESATID